jgi:hypothetical protein
LFPFLPFSIAGSSLTTFLFTFTVLVGLAAASAAFLAAQVRRRLWPSPSCCWRWPPLQPDSSRNKSSQTHTEPVMPRLGTGWMDGGCLNTA